MVFVGHTEDVDSAVNGTRLWKLLAKVGCPDTFVDVIRSSHDGMVVIVQDHGRASETFTLLICTKQGCAMASMIFSMIVFIMLQDAFRDNDRSVCIQMCTSGNIFNLQRVKANTKTTELNVQDLLFADVCALITHTINEIKRITDSFARAARRFGFTSSLRKT